MATDSKPSVGSHVAQVNAMHHALSVFTAFLLPQFLFFFSTFRKSLFFFSLLFKTLFHPGAADLQLCVSILTLTTLALLPALVIGQLSGRVGPLTSHATKRATKTCNVLNYGAVADKSTDLGPSLTSAFAACKSGGTVVIPSGSYVLATWVRPSGGSAWALQLDGIIYRTGTAGGNMIFIEHSNDFELFSSTSKGAIQGNGYIFHAKDSITRPRILRFYEVTNFSMHDIVLIDSSSFHFSMDTCTNGEVYNIAARGGNGGGVDGIDV